MIGWAAPSMPKTEPQHMVKSRMTVSLLKSLGIKYIILTLTKIYQIKKVNAILKTKQYASGLPHQKSLSSTNINKKIKKEIGGVERFDAIKTLLKKLRKEHIISTTGYTSENFSN